MVSAANNTAILLGGAAIDSAVLDRALSLSPRLICADGGANTAVELGLRPEAVVGDMDSVTQDTRAALDLPFHHDTDQETTDFEKALAFAKADILICMGFLGQRLDHSLAAMNALTKFPQKRAILVGTDDICFLSPPDVTLDTAEGDRVSLFPMTSASARSTGLRWPLDGLSLDPVSRIGTSNQATGGRVALTGVTGKILVILPLSHLERTVISARGQVHR